MKVNINIESIDNGFLVNVSEYDADEYGPDSINSIRYAVRDADELLDSLEAALAANIPPGNEY